jgi:hypothetical protein
MERRPDSEWLFPTSEGTKVDTSHLRRSVKRYAEEAGLGELDPISPHTLRHTFATKLYRETGSIRRVQKAGHSDLSTTMIYTHVVDEELEADMKGSGSEPIWQQLPELGLYAPEVAQASRKFPVRYRRGLMPRGCDFVRW